MPIYEFRCDSCQAIFEILALSRGEEIDARCPQCGGESLSRVMSACASVVNGAPSTGGCSAGPSLENRSCGKSDSCTTLTLPGYTR